MNESRLSTHASPSSNTLPSEALTWANGAIGVIGTTGAVVMVAFILSMAWPRSAAAKDVAQPSGKPVNAKVDAAAPADWSVYRGDPGMTGVAPGKLGSKLTRLWRFKTGAMIHSSPVVSAGVLYIGSNDGHLYAIDAKTGKEKWKFLVGPSPEEHKKKHPNFEYEPEQVEAPPMVHEGVVYVGASDGVLYAVDARTGKQKWKFTTEGEILASANWTKGKDGSTRILIGSTDNFLYCLSAKDGKKVWEYETDNQINGAPTIDDDRIVFGGCDGYVHVVNAEDGKKVASVEIEAYIAGTVAMKDGKVYTGHLENRVISVDLVALKQIWSYRDKQFPYHASPAVAGDGGNGVVVIGGRDKRVHAMKASDGTPLWRFRTRGHVDSSPVICDGKVVFGSADGRLYLVDLKTGDKLWEYEAGKPIIASPAVLNGVVYIGGEDGYVYAFGSK